MPALLLVILFWIPGLTVADALPVTRVDSSPPYALLDEAAAAVFEQLAHPFPATEFGGALVARQGWVYYTTPVSIQKKKALGFRVQLSKEESLVGLYHVHPLEKSGLGFASEYFSIDDIEVAYRLNVPIYAGIAKSRNIRVFEPATGTPKQSRPTLGKLVGTLSEREGAPSEQSSSEQKF